jgi:hypothetical protein
MHPPAGTQVTRLFPEGGTSHLWFLAGSPVALASSQHGRVSACLCLHLLAALQPQQHSNAAAQLGAAAAVAASKPPSARPQPTACLHLPCAPRSPALPQQQLWRSPLLPCPSASCPWSSARHWLTSGATRPLVQSCPTVSPSLTSSRACHQRYGQLLLLAGVDAACYVRLSPCLQPPCFHRCSMSPVGALSHPPFAPLPFACLILCAPPCAALSLLLSLVAAGL